MKTVRKFLKFDGSLAEPENADLAREVTFDGQGKLVMSRVYFAKKDGSNTDSKVDKGQPATKDITVQPDHRLCEVCRSPIRSHPLTRLCSRCGKLVRKHNRKKPDKEARIRALKAAWNDPGRVFVCHYSGVPLVENWDNGHSSRCLTFDHRTPRKENDIVICAALLNDMKTDMDETEFKEMVNKLADHFRGGPALGKELLDKIEHLKKVSD